MEEFAEAVRAAVSRRAPFAELVDLLRHYKTRGLEQREARDALEALRAELSDENDRILEVLDVVVGFCAPRLRVWE